MARAEIRRVLAATYHRVWWPGTSIVRFDGDQMPVWDEATGNYLDPATGEVLPTWDQALDAIGKDDQPHHVASAHQPVRTRPLLPTRRARSSQRRQRLHPVHGDQLWGVVREHKGADHTLAALKSIRAARPGGYRLFVILDNLSANKTPAIRRWAKRENVELCFTPVNASWANPIQAQFGPVRTFVMGASDHPSHTVLARKLQAHLRWRNAHARHPDVLAAQRRERARVRSERQQRWGRPKPFAV